MIIPTYLKKGDEVIIIATARKISEVELQPAIDFLVNKGLNVIFGKHIFEIENQFAGTDKNRQQDLQWALNHPTAKAIIIARGGYGTVRLLEGLDFTDFKKLPKWLVGYSDVTVLHNAININGIATIHATMPINFAKHIGATNTLINALFGKDIDINCIPFHLNKIGSTKAEVVGGNLSLLYSLSGTPYDIDTKNKILFIEDLDEYLYHIDRMMMQLKLSGKLAHLKGLIVGGMSDMKDNAIPFGKTAQEIIYDAVKEYNYPVCFEFPAGHIDENLAIILGKEVCLDVNLKAVTLTHS